MHDTLKSFAGLSDAMAAVRKPEANAKIPAARDPLTGRPLIRRDPPIQALPPAMASQK